MDRPTKVGQLLMVAVAAGQADPPAPANRPGSLGGYLLLGGWSSIAAVSARTRVWKRKATRGVDPLVAADQEGGRVQQLRGAGFTTLPTGESQGRLSAADLNRLLSRAGRELRTAGVTVNLAPVADTVPEDVGTRNAPIGRFSRQFGSDPGAVARTVTTAVRALQAGRVAATVKHFPGLGRIRGNTDVTAVSITDVRTDAADPHLQPFRAGIAAGAKLVMVSSARYPRLDPKHQAVFSPAVIDGLLRRRLGFRGVVISDDIGAARAVAGIPVGQRAVRFVSAGGDMVITVRGADVRPMASALLSAADRDPGLARRIDASARRVLTLKADLGLLSCATPGRV
ncbi:MAG TPA: glycoside hydrolase family 3 N-terminal domain-containing protein [Dermatophilaceae bacterium]|nr:glycoside hydrolase family 3 N-terminal domain-containing protein [Dermatophilaceae bacterium]